MEHKGTQRLETDRLVLRKFRREDAAAMYKNWAADGEVTKYLTWPAHSDITVTSKVLEEWVANYEKKDYYQWAILLKEGSDEVIGSIGVNFYDETIGLANIGYCLGRRWWNQGIMSEALQCIIDYLFYNIGFNRIEATHDARNSSSGAVMKKCGMKYEGTLRAAGKNNQGICDNCCYGVLAADWNHMKN